MRGHFEFYAVNNQMLIEHHTQECNFVWLTDCSLFSSSFIFEGEITTTELLLHEGVTKCVLFDVGPPESRLLPLGKLGCAMLVVITVLVTITQWFLVNTKIPIIVFFWWVKQSPRPLWKCIDVPSCGILKNLPWKTAGQGLAEIRG